MKRPTHWRTWEELANAPIPKTILNEAPEPEQETAEARARRIWGMKEGSNDKVH
jgi:hypothetical protein